MHLAVTICSDIFDVFTYLARDTSKRGVGNERDAEPVKQRWLVVESFMTLN